MASTQRIEDLKEVTFTLAAMFTATMFLWGATELVEWVGQVVAERDMLRIEAQESREEFHTMFEAQAEQDKQNEAARKASIKALCAKDVQGCNIMKAR